MESKKGMEMVKVGPHGSGSGKAWNNKGQSMLTQIFISYSSTNIRSIRTAHMVGENLQLSDHHGGNGRIFKTIDIEYPSEFLTGICGYTGRNTAGYTVVKSLRFKTNRREIGPFGLEEGTHFCIQMGTNRCFGGFHGTSDSKYLYSIGVYTKPFNPCFPKIQGRIP